MNKEKLKALKEQYSEKIIDGNAISKQIRSELKEKCSQLIASQGIRPGLTVILVGDDPASAVYVRNKQKACEEIGYFSELKKLPAQTSESELLSIIKELNNNPTVHGILVQLPLPKHINEQKILYAISPNKDVDGFHPYNIGRMVIQDPLFLPCTPAGIVELIHRSGIKTVGQKAVIIGRSLIVGKPMANLLLQKGLDATVTVAHSRTKDLKQEILQADIIIAAIGQSKMIKADMVREGATIIDVGMNQDDDGTLIGDVDFAGVIDKVHKITPVPGGVGPMTIAMLMHNTFLAATHI